MVKKKIAVIAACSISVAAFASTNGVEKHRFGPLSIKSGESVSKWGSVYKEDRLPAWVRVDEGLSSGNTFVTFQVFNKSGIIATDPKDVWVNGEHYIDYRSGQGDPWKFYFLRCSMEPQAHADSLDIDGVWAP